MAENELPEPGSSRTALERIPLRTREQQVTLSGWRLELASPRGKGAIVLAGAHYRGEGMCLGWTQERLKAVYDSLLPDEREENESIQLG